MGDMFHVAAERRPLYGLCLGILLLANLAGGAAVVIARAGTAHPTLVSDPAAGLPDTPTVPDPGPPNSGLVDCGQGSATARAVLDQTETGYVLRATVANDSNRVVELDRLVVRAVYPDGIRTFDAGGAGPWIPAGVPDAAFAIPDSASAARPMSFVVADFAFHTAGRPDCAAR
jgi:hypothetical protein